MTSSATPVSPRTARALEKFNKDFEKIKKEIFSFFDKDCDKTLTYDELVTAIRSVGVIVSESDLERIRDSNSGRTRYDFSNFSSLVESFREKRQVASIPAANIDHLKTLRQAFDAVDVKGSGHVSPSAIREVLCGMGDKLSVEEFDKLFSDASGDKITFEKFVGLISNNVISRQ